MATVPHPEPLFTRLSLPPSDFPITLDQWQYFTEMPMRRGFLNSWFGTKDSTGPQVLGMYIRRGPDRQLGVRGTNDLDMVTS